MLHEKSCLIINMPKIMIIKYQQFAKTNTFSLSFHILFSPFLHIFPHFSPRHIEIRIWGWAKMGLDPPPNTIHVLTVYNNPCCPVSNDRYISVITIKCKLFFCFWHRNVFQLRRVKFMMLKMHI